MGSKGATQLLSPTTCARTTVFIEKKLMNIWTKTRGFGVFFRQTHMAMGILQDLRLTAPQMDLSCFSLNHYWGTTCRDIHVATWMFDQHVLGFISIQWPFLHILKNTFITTIKVISVVSNLHFYPSLHLLHIFQTNGHHRAGLPCWVAGLPKIANPMGWSQIHVW